ncbi:MAG TPA: hypothetical protein VNH18_12600 [Bryobacteraceae bacterium]|nr:hypothetical protein [Bryobacteraceae bacterium]
MNDAERHLHQALKRCLRINNVEREADILIDLERMRLVYRRVGGVRRLAGRRSSSSNVAAMLMQVSDAHLVLAQLAKERGDANALGHHATESLRLATCDGPPDYTYKAAYHEATALLR